MAKVKGVCNATFYLDYYLYVEPNIKLELPYLRRRFLSVNRTLHSLTVRRDLIAYPMF